MAGLVPAIYAFLRVKDADARDKRTDTTAFSTVPLSLTFVPISVTMQRISLVRGVASRHTWTRSECGSCGRGL
jgi:hypothetical protein